MKDTRHEAISGALLGSALGDALAAPTEFVRDVREIEARWGNSGPTAPEGDPARVTDDTQMLLAVGEALMQAQKPYTAATVEKPLRDAFVAWMISPDNTRAPGVTCMTACRDLLRGKSWEEATRLDSKGCGANMRVAPVGLLLGESDETRAALAQFQAALTHGHPTGLAASDLTARAVYLLATHQVGAPADLPAALQEYARSQRTVYHSAWLAGLWERSGRDSSPAAFIARGWDECLACLGRLDQAVANGDRQSDPCAATGAGWIAEEALATGLLCFLLFPDDPVVCLRRAAVTSGDSDSIAAIAGALAGAWHGISAWPPDWLARIEYKERLNALAVSLAL